MKCPMCGKKTFTLFRKLTECPNCGAALANIGNNTIKKAKSSFDFPPRTGTSMEDNLKKMQQDAQEMGGGRGSMKVIAKWDDIFKGRPFDIPFYTAIGDRPIICVSLSAACIPDLGWVRKFVSRDVPYPAKLQVVAFLRGNYPILRVQFVIPDNPRDPLIVETPLDISGANVQDFIQAVCKDNDSLMVDIVFKHESISDGYFAASASASGLAAKWKPEVEKVIKAYNPNLTRSDFKASVRLMESVYTSSSAGLEAKRCVSMNIEGEAKYRFIIY